MNNEIESQTGVKSFSGGINGNSLGGSATGARGALDATATRRMNLVRNVAENLMKPLMRKWMAYNSEFLEEEEVVRITNAEYVPIRRDDLDGNIDIDIEISTAEDNAAKAQELAFLIQTMGPNEDPEVIKLLRIEHLVLMKLPDAAKKLEDYVPQPDPMQEQLKKLELQKMQLEIQKLASEIKRNDAKAQEDQIDAQLKQQKVGVEAAKARSIHSKADLDDMKYLKEDNQVDEQITAETDDRRHAQAMQLEHLRGLVKAEKEGK